MGACLTKADTAEGPWRELLPEIAGLILRHLPDHGDRLSFGAVCHGWRLAAGQQGLPPAMPCVNLGDGTYQSLIGDGKVRRFPAPKGYRPGASFVGGWLFYYHKGSRRCFLRRPFSSSAIEVPTRHHGTLVDFPTAATWALRIRPDPVVLGRCMDMKIVVSSHLVVALFRHPHPLSYVTSFRPAQQLLRWSFIVQPDDPPHPAYIYMDIAFYNGKVFALSFAEKLFCHAVDGETTHHHPQPIVVDHVIGARGSTYSTASYLVVSSDKQKLLMVRWRRSYNADDHWGMDLWVFEADFGKGRWLEVKDLGGQVLFLGKNCSMAFATGSTKQWAQRFRGGNRVFVLGAEWARLFRDTLPYKGDIPSYCVYDMVSGKTSLVWLHVSRNMGSCTLGWVFPRSEDL